MAQAEEPAGIRSGAAEIARMEEAAAALDEHRRALVDGRGGILAEIAPEGGALAPWRHYPEEEIYDPHTHAQYFFHVHPPDGRPGPEYGHFHVFLRAEGMPPGVAPFHLPEIAVANVRTLPPQGAPLRRGVREEVCHLVAIAVDRRGEPIRLFTTNRWVTGETWYRAEDVIRMLDGFSLTDKRARTPSQRLGRRRSRAVSTADRGPAAGTRHQGAGLAPAAAEQCIRGSAPGDYVQPGCRSGGATGFDRKGAVASCRRGAVPAARTAADGRRVGGWSGRMSGRPAQRACCAGKGARGGRL